MYSHTVDANGVITIVPADPETNPLVEAVYDENAPDAKWTITLRHLLSPQETAAAVQAHLVAQGW